MQCCKHTCARYDRLSIIITSVDPVVVVIVVLSYRGDPGAGDREGPIVSEYMYTNLTSAFPP